MANTLTCTNSITGSIRLTSRDLEFLLTVEEMHLREGCETQERRMSPGESVFSMESFTELAGFMGIIRSIYYLIPLILGTDIPITSTLVWTILKTTEPSHAVLPLTIYEEMMLSQNGWIEIQRLDCVLCSEAYDGWI